MMNDTVIIAMTYGIVGILFLLLISALIAANKIRKDLQEAGRLLAALRNPTDMSHQAQDN